MPEDLTGRSYTHNLFHTALLSKNLCDRIKYIKMVEKLKISEVNFCIEN